jgi:hypothetical protein
MLCHKWLSTEIGEGGGPGDDCTVGRVLGRRGADLGRNELHWNADIFRRYNEADRCVLGCLVWITN